VNLTLEDLSRWANELAQEHWSVDYTGSIELVNRKWRSMNGCFSRHKTDKSKQIIRMSSQRNAVRTTEEIKRTLLHELVHWRLFNIGKPSRDKDDCFVAECLRVGASFSKTRSAQAAFQRHQSKIARG
jgi:poly(3-hydroxybutyrate) depolymerase